MPTAPALAEGEVQIVRKAEDADGDAVKVDLYYDADERPGGEVLLAEGLPAEGRLPWTVPGAKPVPADLSSNGTVDAPDLLQLALHWEANTQAAPGYRIMARAFNAKGAMDQARSPGAWLTPDTLPATREGLLRLMEGWKSR